MKAVLQRTISMSLEIEGEKIADCGPGFLVLVSAEKGDDIEDCKYLAKKCVGLRVFSDSDGRMNLSLEDMGGEMLIVSNFTLSADCVKGRRPSFLEAARPEEAKILYSAFVAECRALGARVSTGVFGADMKIGLINDGPVTIPMDTKTMLRK